MEKEVRVRFAPSPTGPFHIGGARSALFNYLLAKKSKGKLILRIEDTDLERSSRESEENIKAALRWLGLDWDEGIDVGGPHAPYRQTERLELYRQYAQQLLAAGQAYYCYCTDEELEAERQSLLKEGKMPRYMGRCRDLSPEQQAAFESEGRKPTIRFRVPEHQEIAVRDLVRGTVVFDSDNIGDFVIMKSDGLPTYNFAVVIDDHAMNITHVIRAEEHLSNTPRQCLIYDALNFPQPVFGHISLILGKDHTKMSKRHGATSVDQYRRLGYLPEAIVNFLALLAKPHLREKGYITGRETGKELEWLQRVTATAQEHVAYGAQIPAAVSLYFEDEFPLEDEEAKAVLCDPAVPAVMENFLRELAKAEPEDAPSVKAVFKTVQKATGLKGKAVFMPVRVALTGKQHGPELAAIIPLLGEKRCRKRIEASLAKAGVKVNF